MNRLVRNVLLLAQAFIKRAGGECVGITFGKKCSRKLL